MISIFCCCGSGLGSSLMMKMSAEEALTLLGITDYEVAFGQFSAIPYMTDLIICSEDIARALHTRIPVIALQDLMDEQELAGKLKTHLERLSS